MIHLAHILAPLNIRLIRLLGEFERQVRQEPLRHQHDRDDILQQRAERIRISQLVAARDLCIRLLVRPKHAHAKACAADDVQRQPHRLRRDIAHWSAVCAIFPEPARHHALGLVQRFLPDHVVVLLRERRACDLAVLPPYCCLGADHILAKDVDAGINFDRFGEVVATGGDLGDRFGVSDV